MQSAMRPYVAAGAALLGASVVAVNPVVSPQALEQGVERVSNAAVQLASADAAADLTSADLANIPYNFFASIANLPYYEFSDPISTATVAGGDIAYTTVPNDMGGVGVVPIPETSLGDIGLFDNVLNYEGPFFVVNAVNVLGIDPGDPPKIAAFADILTGNPQLGDAVSSQLIPIAEAEAPLEAGCTIVSSGGCPDPLQILMGSNQSTGFDPLGTSHVDVPGYFSVPIQQFFTTGYTFPGTESDPLLNPVPAGEPIPPGITPGTPTNPIPPTADGATGYETLPWSGEHVLLDQNGPANAYFDYLTQNPANNPIEPLPSLTDVTTDLNSLTTGLFNTFNPFVNGTYCFICAPFVPGDTTTGLGSLFDTSSLGSLFDGSSSAMTTDLSSLLDPSTFTTDLTALLGNSATDLTALLGATGAEDLTNLFASALPDLATTFADPSAWLGLL